MFTQKKSLFLSLLLATATPILTNGSAQQSIQIPEEIVQNIQQDIASNEVFTSLTQAEKKLFLEALFCLFVGSSLEAMEQSRKAQIKVGNALARATAQLEKIHQLQNDIYASKQACFTTIETDSRAVIPALEHVRSNGQLVTTHALTALDTKLADYNQKLSAMVAIIAHNMLEAQEKLGKPDLQTYGEDIPACVANFDNTMTICNSLAASCQDLDKALIVRLYITNAVIVVGLELLNVYYTTVYQQIDTADLTNLPVDLLTAHQALLQNLD